MKTVSRNVVEIIEPKDENIERVIVFMRSGCALHVSRRRAVAQEYADKLLCAKEPWYHRLWRRRKTAGIALGVFLPVVLLLVWLVWF